MIKVNLASRKASRLGGDGNEGGGGAAANLSDIQAKLMGGLSQFRGLRGLSFEDLKGLPFFKVAACLIIAFVAKVAISYYQGVDLDRLNTELKHQQDESKHADDLLKTTKGFAAIQTALEADEKTIRTKLEVIQKLIQDRKKPPQLLLALSSLIPQDVWLSEFKLDATEAHFHGQALGFIQVSDFMRNLNESADFADVKPGATTTAQDPSGIELTNFDLTARRR